MSTRTDSSTTVVIEKVREAISERLNLVAHRRDKSKLAAAALFFEHGAYPSASQVRAVTQHGSLTDIQSDLREFWQDLRATASRTVSLPRLPEGLAAVMGPAIQAMWVSALDAANETVAELRDEVSLKVEAANQAASSAQARLEEIRSHMEAQSVLIEQGRAVLLDSQREVASLQQQIASRDAALAAAEASLAASEQARAALQAVLAEGLDGLRKSTDKASDAFRGEINFLKMQVDNARSAERDLREQLQSSRHGREVELQVVRQQNNGLLEANGRLTLVNQELLNKLGIVSK
jgi:hypothetical protein